MALLHPELDFATAPLPDLHAVLGEIREQTPVAAVCFHGEIAYLTTRHAVLADAFANEDAMPSAAIHEHHAQPVMGRTIQCMTGEEHRIHRALASVAFRPAVMQRSVETLLEPLAHELIDGFAEHGSAELVEAFTHRFPFRVICRLLGIPVEDEEEMLGWALGLIDFPWNPEAALRASEAFTRYLEPLVEERRRQPGEDLISELAGARVEGHRLSDEEIYSFVRLLFPAGSDTTYKAIGSLLHLVLEQPGLRERLREHPEEQAGAVEEALRCEPPVALLPRRAAKHVVLAGVEVPANSPMLFGIAAANRDPRVYEDPDRFDWRRRTRGLLPFGKGVHFCLGSHLARREMEVALGALLERLPRLRLVEPDRGRIVGAVMRGPESLPVRWD